jgi:casein kinase 1
LPWQGLKAATNKQKYEKIGEKKQTTAIRDLCDGFPEQLQQYLTYVRNLAFEETPDYDYLRDLFTQALKVTGEVEDGDYDWHKINGGKGWDSTNKKPNLHGYGHPYPQQGNNRHSQAHLQARLSGAGGSQPQIPNAAMVRNASKSRRSRQAAPDAGVRGAGQQISSRPKAQPAYQQQAAAAQPAYVAPQTTSDPSFHATQQRQQQQERKGFFARISAFCCGG